MNKIEEKHLEILKGNLSCDLYHRVNNKEHAALKCAEITKEYAEKFAEWIRKTYFVGENEWVENWVDKRETAKTTSELWSLFINDLNEKG